MLLRSLLLIISCLNLSLLSQSLIGEWRYYHAYPTIQQLVSAKGYLWGISEGGLLKYSPRDSSFQTFDRLAGLGDVKIKCMTLDSCGNLWLGMDMPSGEIDLFNTEKDMITKRWNLGLTAILSLTHYQDRVLALYQQNLNNGVLEFRLQEEGYEYQDFYPNLPGNPNQLNSIVVYQDTIWIGADIGVIKAYLYHPNLKDITAWQVDETFGGEVKVVRSGSYLWIHSQQGYFLYVNGNVIHKFITGSAPLSLSGDPVGNLYVTFYTGILKIDLEGKRTYFSHDRAFCTAVDDEGVLWVGGRKYHGIGEVGGELRLPESPVSNIFTALKLRRNGDLIAAGKEGISILQNGHWKNYLRWNDDTTFTPYHNVNLNGYFQADTVAYYPQRVNTILEGTTGEIIFSVEHVYAERPDDFWGGIYEIDFESPEERYLVYDTTGGVLPGTEPPGGPDYMVVKGMTLDTRGNLFVCMWASKPAYPLLVRKADGEWLRFSISDAGNKLSLYPLEVLLDRQNRVYLCQQEPGGITILDYNGTLEDKSDDRWYRISTADGLASNTVWSFDLDSKGNLWVLTSSGVQEIQLREDFDSGPVRGISRPVLTSIPFGMESRLRIDPLDNKWILTQTHGVKVLKADGNWYPDIEGFTRENSGLLDNKVLAVEFNPQRGLVYLATARGLAVLKSPFQKTGRKYANVKAFPSPFNPNQGDFLIIDNLLHNSVVKIITLNGEVIRTLEPARGEIVGTQAYWDGRDEKGRTVPTGVYLLYIYSPDGATYTHKVAVIED